MHLILFLLATLAVVFLPIGKNEYYNNIRRRKVAIITAMGVTPILTFVTFGSKAAVNTTYVVVILIATIIILCAGWLRYDNKKSNREEKTAGTSSTYNTNTMKATTAPKQRKE